MTKNVFQIITKIQIGYSSLHLACAWNQLESVKHIIAAGGDNEQKTVNGEKPIDIARRYHHHDLVEYLEWIGKIFTVLLFLTMVFDFELL